MATDIEFTLKTTVNNTAPGISPKAVSSTSDIDIEKTFPTLQDKSISSIEIPDTTKSQSIEFDVNALEDVVSKLNEYVNEHKRDIRFEIDKESNKTVVRLLDSNGDVLKQIPSEEVLAILKGIENNKSLFLNYEV